MVNQNRNLLSEILWLVENIEETDNKITILSIIRQLAEEPSNWIEIGKLEGFSKLFKLILEKDEKILEEILVTLNYFLIHPPFRNSTRTLNAPNPSFPIPSEDSFIWKRKVSTAFGDVRSAISNWKLFQKVFYFFSPFFSPFLIFFSQIFWKKETRRIGK